MVETVNAVIKSADIMFDDKGNLTIWLDLDYGGLCQGFGGYKLCTSKKDNTGKFISKMMKVCDVIKFDKIVGKAVRVRKTDNNDILAVGHIIKDIWFIPSQELK